MGEVIKSTVKPIELVILLYTAVGEPLFSIQISVHREPTSLMSKGTWHSAARHKHGRRFLLRDWPNRTTSLIKLA